MVQLYAMVPFGTDDDQTLTWMTHGRRLEAKSKPFMNNLGYGDEGLESSLGLCPHKRPGSGTFLFGGHASYVHEGEGQDLRSGCFSCYVV